MKDMFDNCRLISDFFNNSPKRFEKSSEIIETLMPGTTAFKLINICKTRWIQRINRLSRFHEGYKATYVTLAKIRDNDIFNGNGILKPEPLQLGYTNVCESLIST